MKKVYAEVYGCPSNIADFETALSLLKGFGHEIVDSSQNSDINIIFTCTVKTPTEKRMIQRIQQFSKSKRPLIVAGCMPKVQQRMIEKISPSASLIGPNVDSISTVVGKALNGEKIIILPDKKSEKECAKEIRKNPRIGIVKISDGCLSACSYCIVKRVRGRLHSHPIPRIVREVKKVIEDGCEEIRLTSQDNGCYGLDIGSNLPALLREILKIEKEFSLRVGMMNPTHAKSFVDELVEVYKDERIKKFLHLPVQSGSDRILKLMNRGYEVNDFVEIVEKFRDSFKNIVISTDIIVGFPGETEEDFQTTVDLLERVKPQKVNLSKFGARPLTEASKMKQLPVEIINERSSKLHHLIESFQ